MKQGHIPVLLTEQECQFIVEFCSRQINMDLSLKLALTKASGKTVKAVVRFTDDELPRLIDVLKLKAALYTTSISASAWASELALYLSKEDKKLKSA